MSEISYDVRKWKDLGFADKMKYSIASLLVLSSIIIGFGSFIWLAMIPTSVIALSGLWLSTALAILGISSYFHNEMVQFQGKINDKIKKTSNFFDFMLHFARFVTYFSIFFGKMAFFSKLFPNSGLICFPAQRKTNAF